MFELEVRHFSIPLRQSLQIGQATLQQREGRWLRLRSRGGPSAWSECAPLPGLHRESLTDTDAALVRIRTTWLRCLNTDDVLQTFKSTAKLYVEQDVPVSLRFALDALFLNDVFLNASEVLSETFQTPWLQPTECRPVQALLWGAPSDWLQALKQRWQQGYRTFKVKVGRAPVHEERMALHDLIRHMPATARLRLDANRLWSFEQACTFLKGIDLAPIDYLEEPLADPSLLPLLSSRCACPLALDESLQEWAYSAAPSVEQVAHVIPGWAEAQTLVIKPATLGGWEDWSHWKCLAQQHQKALVVSSCFESPIGIASLALWSSFSHSQIPKDHQGHALERGVDTHNVLGLDTERWLALPPASLAVEQGRITQHRLLSCLRGEGLGIDS
ncbi:MAG: o-succinylbenzoate synthase [Myxococcota bacterium]